MPIRLHPRIAELVRFAVVGGSATLVHAVAYLVLTSLSPLSAQASNAVGFLSAFGVSLLGHYRYTFRDTAGARGLAASGWRLLIVGVFGYFCNAAFIQLVTETLHLDARFALVPIIGITPLLIYGLSKVWVFRAR